MGGFFSWFIICTQNSAKLRLTMNDIKGFYNASIHPGQISIYYESTNPTRKSINQFVVDQDTGELIYLRPPQFNSNHHNGTISKIAYRKISRAVDYLVYLVPKRKYFTTADGRAGSYFLSFVTLTLSSQQIHSDNEIKSCLLEPLLNEMRKKWKVSNYIWRAEKQSNGDLHFHIVADRFIWWNDLRNSWNYYQERLGYVTRYRINQKAWHSEGFRFRPELSPKWSRSQQYKAYQVGLRNDWNSPNSTDVHSLKTISSVRSYICKYITKSEDRQNISGRLWGCSYELTDLKGSREFAQGNIADDLNKLVSSESVKVYKSDYYTVIYFTRADLQQLCLYHIMSSLDNYLRQKFPEYHPPELFEAA